MSEKHKLTKSQLLEELAKCADSHDTEVAHADADGLLVEYIDDDEIAEAYSKVSKWYA